MPEGVEVERDANGPSKPIYLAVISAAISVVLIAGFVYWKVHSGSGDSTAPVQRQLAGALRPGSPEFTKLMADIRMDTPEATQDQTALGGQSMNLFTTVRNFTGKTITGLEMKGTVVDLKKNPVKERVLIVIPDHAPPLETSKAIPVRIRIEGFKPTDDRANIKMEITGLTVE